MLIGVKDSQSDLEKHYKTFCGLYCRQEYNKRVVYSKPQCIRTHHGVSLDWSPD